MKTTIKFFLVVILFTSTVFADGNMGNGSRNCPTGTTCLTEPLPIENQPAESELKTTEAENSILGVVQEYLESVFEYFEN